MGLNNKKILIAGMGKSGIAVLDFISKKGNEISVCDERDIEWDEPRLYKRLKMSDINMYFNGSDIPDEDWNEVILSPGIPLEKPFVENAKKKGAKVIGELELAFRSIPGHFVAITGTNGKTTTTSLVGEIFKYAGKDTMVVGNIGKPVVTRTLESTEDTWLITEVSSFQLETVDTFKPEVSAILNLTPDHMDRHKTMENYAQAKAKIFANQNEDNFLIYNYDDSDVTKVVKDSKACNIPFSRKSTLERGVFVEDNKIIIKDPKIGQKVVIMVDELKMLGTHNLENALAAAGIAFYSGISIDDIAHVLKEFKGVEHRMEHIATINGVTFINDSKGTNPDASMKALEAVNPGVFLIAGGYEKDSDFKGFIESFNGKVKQLLLIGETANRIKETAEELGFTDVTICENLPESTRMGFRLAEEGDTILLSPASASWDMYKSYEERGNHFRETVEELRKTIG